MNVPGILVNPGTTTRMFTPSLTLQRFVAIAGKLYLDPITINYTGCELSLMKQDHVDYKGDEVKI